MKKHAGSSTTKALLFAGTILLAAGVFLSLAGGVRTILGALAAAAGGFLVSASRKKEPAPRISLPPRRPVVHSPAPKAETTAPAAVTTAPGPLDKTDRDRLVEWLAEPVEILEAARKSGELGGFNHARSCQGMAQLAAWRRSKGFHHPDADALAEAAEDAVLEAILGAAEYFSPIVESLSRRGELPSDIDRSRAKVEQVRKQTIAILSEIRARLSNLPVSAQESFGFVAQEQGAVSANA